MFGMFLTSPSRWNSSGATAWKPSFAKRRAQSLMYSCTPQISETTSRIGWLVKLSGRAS